MINAIRYADFFRKVQQDVQFEQTKTGGCITFLMFLLVFTLIAYEVQLTIFGELNKMPYVAFTTGDERIRVNLNITFHEIGCGFLSIDYQDTTGTHLENIQHDLYKLRLDSDGNFQSSSQAQQVRTLENKINHPSLPQLYYNNKSSNEKTHDCYGAELTVGQKCITCNDVMIAYAARNWPMPPVEAISQCMPDGKARLDMEEVKKQEQEQRKKMLEEQQRQQQEILNQRQEQQRLRQQQQAEQQRRNQEIQQQKIREQQEAQAKHQQEAQKLQQEALKQKEAQEQLQKQQELQQQQEQQAQLQKEQEEKQRLESQELEQQYQDQAEQQQQNKGDDLQQQQPQQQEEIQTQQEQTQQLEQNEEEIQRQQLEQEEIQRQQQEQEEIQRQQQELEEEQNKIKEEEQWQAELDILLQEKQELEQDFIQNIQPLNDGQKEMQFQIQLSEIQKSIILHSQKQGELSPEQIQEIKEIEEFIANSSQEIQNSQVDVQQVMENQLFEIQEFKHNLRNQLGFHSEEREQELQVMLDEVSEFEIKLTQAELLDTQQLEELQNIKNHFAEFEQQTEQLKQLDEAERENQEMQDQLDQEKLEEQEEEQLQNNGRRVLIQENDSEELEIKYDQFLYMNVTKFIIQVDELQKQQNKDKQSDLKEYENLISTLNVFSINQNHCNQIQDFGFQMNMKYEQIYENHATKNKQIKMATELSQRVSLNTQDCSVSYNLIYNLRDNTLQIQNYLSKEIITVLNTPKLDKNTTDMFELEIKILYQNQQISQKQDQLNQISILLINNNQTQKLEKQNNKITQQNQRRNLFAGDFGHEYGEDQSFTQQEMAELQTQIGEGCQIYGHLFVKKVPGNFHISFHGRGMANLFIQNLFSVKHTVNLLEFTTNDSPLTQGQVIQATNPIDGQFHNTTAGFDQDYYIKIVNAQFENMVFTDHDLYLYTSLSSEIQRNQALPSITFKYEFDPISMKYKSHHQGFVTFMISLCAILGGAFSLSKFFHSVLA